MPVYKAIADIEACLVSVLEQLPDDCELICIDDGSPDESMALARQVIDRYPGLRHNVSCIAQANQGLSGARNTGIRLARGRYIGFLDADDVLAPSYFERLRDVVDREPTASIVCFNAQRLTTDASGAPRHDFLPVHAGAGTFDPQSGNGYAALADDFARGRWFAWARLYEQGLFKTHQFTLGFKYQDMLLLPELYRRSRRIVNIDDQLVTYRIHGASITARPDSSTFQNLDAIIDYYLRRSPGLSAPLDGLRHLVVLSAIESVFHAARRMHGTRAARAAMRKRQARVGAARIARVLVQHGARMNRRSLLLQLSPSVFHGAGVIRRTIRCD